MEFRDLKKQYQILKSSIDEAVQEVMTNGNFISGKQVTEIEERLADYVERKYCISCANGTDALSIALAAWNIGPGEAVFVPDFTFFSTAEVVAACGATPIFVDVEQTTYNIDCTKLEQMINAVMIDGNLVPKAIIAVDLFGQPADFVLLEQLAKKYNLYLLEDGAQGFGGCIGNRKACSFGDISTTSFFPAKPLGCYGDGGAIFTDNEEWAHLIRSLCVHGKGEYKYDNVRIGVNSRLDTMQAALLKVKLQAFSEYELEEINQAARYYTEKLSGMVQVPIIRNDFHSSWAQYVIQLPNEEQRNALQKNLKEKGIPTMVYYPKPLHAQQAFSYLQYNDSMLGVSKSLTQTVLALPIHPYITIEEQDFVINSIIDFLK